jgi:CDP-diacylglycerol--glycerol-3-phosphate 3-phosphatidyltransferase
LELLERQRMKYLPNALTIVRMLVTPAVLFLMFSDAFGPRAWGATLFILASISDYLDGKLARHYGAGSKLGQFLDPVADKVLVLGTFAALYVLREDLVPFWAVATIAGRDLGVTVLRIWYTRTGRTLRTSSAAKWKTTFQLTFLITVLVMWAAALLPGEAGQWANWILHSMIIKGLLWATVAVTVATGFAYMASPQFDSEDE